MPNEQVRCENCGGTDVRQTAPGSYVCEHCDTQFHWVDPTKRTVVREPRLCECGRPAKLFCCRCKRGFCDNYRRRGPSCLVTLREQAEGGGPLESQLSKVIDSFGPMDAQMQDLVRRTAESHGIPSHSGFLCATCSSAFWTRLEPALEPLRRGAVEEGRLCRECFSNHQYVRASDFGYYYPSQRRCATCGAGMCSSHGIKCEKCHQPVCSQHVVDGRFCAKCGASMAFAWGKKLRKWFGIEK